MQVASQQLHSQWQVEQRVGGAARAAARQRRMSASTGARPACPRRTPGRRRTGSRSAPSASARRSLSVLFPEAGEGERGTLASKSDATRCSTKVAKGAVLRHCGRAVGQLVISLLGCAWLCWRRVARLFPCRLTAPSYLKVSPLAQATFLLLEKALPLVYYTLLDSELDATFIDRKTLLPRGDDSLNTCHL